MILSAPDLAPSLKPSGPAPSAQTFVWALLRFSRPGTSALLVASLAINVLVLTSPIYMLQVYDRVLTSYSLETLFFLTVIMLVLFGVMSAIEQQRSKLSLRLGARLADSLGERMFEATMRERLRGGSRLSGLQDVDTLRQFVSSGSLTIFLDLPMLPLFVIIAALLSPLLGLMTLGAAAVLVLLAGLSELATREASREASLEQIMAAGFANSSLRNAQTIQAMGMMNALRGRWAVRNRKAVGLQLQASDRSAVLLSLTRYTRIAVQSLVLGVGAYLVIRQKMTPGMMIAAAVLLGRGLAPIEQAVGAWRGMLAARDAYARIEILLAEPAAPGGSVDLPAAVGKLAAEGLTVEAPGVGHTILSDVSFVLAPGQSMAILGMSGAGKTTLVKALVGAVSATRGLVRLDDAALADWPQERLGRALGYLPQEIELFDGSVADNIGRFQALDSKAVTRAAQAAGIHEMILRLPNGYDTPIGEGGWMLSGGQRQRIGLARALYGDPVLVILDEPNSNLDAEGEAALADVFAVLKARRASLVVVSHRVHLVSQMDLALVLGGGVIHAFGPMSKIAPQLTGSRPGAMRS